MDAIVRRPAYVAGFVLVLVLAQLTALGVQFARGYRPFFHAPTRVPLSWDMFSTAISRCDVRWEPPLPHPSGRFARLRDAGRALEWDPVYDRVPDYIAAGMGACRRATEPTLVHLACFTSEGRSLSYDLPCR